MSFEKEAEEKFGKLTRLTKKHAMAVCPFHGDSDPSMSVDIERGLFYCFGCGKGGRLYGEGREVTYEGIDSLLSESVSKEYFVGKERFEGFEPLGESALWYLQQERGFERRVLDFFGLKYCRNGKYKNRVIIPIGDGFSARLAMNKNCARLLYGSNYRRYLFSTGFDLAGSLFIAERKTKEVYIVEGIFDAMKVFQYGFSSIALLSSLVNQEKVRKIIDFHGDVRVPILALDGDFAGDSARGELKMALWGTLSKVEQVYLPEGQDPCSLNEDEFLSLKKTDALETYDFAGELFERDSAYPSLI